MIHLCEKSRLGKSLVAQMIKSLTAMWEMGVQSLSQEGPLEKEMQPTPVFWSGKIPWTEESSGLQSLRSQRVEHDWRLTYRKRQKGTERLPRAGTGAAAGWDGKWPSVDTGFLSLWGGGLKT